MSSPPRPAPHPIFAQERCDRLPVWTGHARRPISPVCASTHRQPPELWHNLSCCAVANHNADNCQRVCLSDVIPLLSCLRRWCIPSVWQQARVRSLPRPSVCQSSFPLAHSFAPCGIAALLYALNAPGHTIVIAAVWRLYHAVNLDATEPDAPSPPIANENVSASWLVSVVTGRILVENCLRKRHWVRTV